MLISVILKQVRKLFCQSHCYDNDRVERQLTRCKALFLLIHQKETFPVVVGGDIVIIEGERERLKEVGKEGGEERGGSVWWPWRCFRNLIASTFAYLRAVCLRMSG